MTGRLMKHVMQVKRPNGAVHLYLRKKGLPHVRLESQLPPAGAEAGSALEQEVKRWLDAFAAQTPRPGTLRGLLREYELKDAGFLARADSTKYEYRLILKELEETLGGVPVAAFTPAYVLALRDAWAERGYRCANMRRQVLKNVLKRALIVGDLKADPFALVGQAPRPKDAGEPHRLWSAEVVELAIRAAIASRRYGLARAVAIARYVGVRRGDLVALSDKARADGRFRFLSGKRRVPVDAPEDPELTRWLDEIPAAQPDDPRAGRKLPANVTRLPPTTLVFNLANERYSEDGLGLELGKLMAALHLANTIDSPAYDLHGLRHTRGVELALAGCTDAQGAALLGHASPSSFAQYRRQADRIRLADDGAAKVIQLRRQNAPAPVATESAT